MNSNNSTIASDGRTLGVTQSVRTAFNIINTDVSNHIGIKELALKAGTNECSLKRGFRLMYRTSIYQYLIQARMKKANLLLKSTRLKHTDIAMECGYESLAGFVTAYRKYFGTAPGTYRKAYLQKKIFQ